MHKRGGILGWALSSTRFWMSTRPPTAMDAGKGGTVGSQDRTRARADNPSSGHSERRPKAVVEESALRAVHAFTGSFLNTANTANKAHPLEWRCIASAPSQASHLFQENGIKLQEVQEEQRSIDEPLLNFLQF